MVTCIHVIIGGIPSSADSFLQILCKSDTFFVMASPTAAAGGVLRGPQKPLLFSNDGVEQPLVLKLLLMPVVLPTHRRTLQHIFGRSRPSAGISLPLLLAIKSTLSLVRPLRQHSSMPGTALGYRRKAELASGLLGTYRVFNALGSLHLFRLR